MPDASSNARSASELQTVDRAALAAWSAVLLCATHGFAPLLAPLAPVPLLLALRGATIRQAFYLGLLCGAGESLIVAGIAYAGRPIFAAMLISFALTRALFAVVARFADVRSPLGAWQVGGLWVVVEALHATAILSAPSILGNTQATSPLLPLARVGGAYLLSFVWVVAAASLTCVWLDWRAGLRRSPRRLVPWGVMVAVLFVGALSTRPTPTGKPLGVTVVQGGLPTWFYDRAENDLAWRDAPEAIYAGLTASAAADTLVVWPETAVWHVWNEAPQFMERMYEIAATRAGLLFGVPRRDGNLVNSAVLLSAGAEQAVDKRRLALLAEHRFAPGPAPPWLDYRGEKLGVLFCLETVVPHYARELASQASVLVVLAEGGRFGTTWVGRMHADYSVLRAVETGRPIVHAGQHGFSTFIDAEGTRSEILPPFTAATLRGAVAPSVELTPYVRFGDWIVWIGGVLSATLALGRSRAAR